MEKKQQSKSPGCKEILKIAVLGDFGVGKTSLIAQHTLGTFNARTPSSTGAVYTSKVMEIDGQKYELQIWDTAGQTIYRSIASIYFRDAHGILLIYDVTNRQSFEDLNHWFNEIYTKCEQSVVIMVVGNKDDKPNKAITVAEANEMATSHKSHHMFVSASTGKNIEDAFSDLVRCIINSDILSEISKRHTNSTSIRRELNSVIGDGKKTCAC